MDEKFVSYLAFESVTTRLERTIKRLWILIIILIIALVGTNASWIYYESQWEVVETTQVTQDIEATADNDSDIHLSATGGDYNGSKGKDTSDSNQN